MKTPLTGLVVLTMAAVAGAAVAAAPPKTGVTIFSDACASPGGDFAGYRVTIVRQASALKVTVEFNDSGPDGEAVARDVKFDQASGKLSFQYEGDLPHTFVGTVSATTLQGAFDGKNDTLPAVKSTPKILADCGAHPGPPRDS